MLTCPVYLKKDSHLEAELARLERENGDKVKIARIKAQLRGEEEIMARLETLDMPLIILRDVNISYGGSESRINFMVFTRKMAFVIECDDLHGDITIHHDGSFTRVCHMDGVRLTDNHRPIEDNKNHMALIAHIKRDEMRGFSKFFQRIMHFDNWYKPVIVLTDVHGSINDREMPKNIKQKITRADLLTGYIKNTYSDSNEVLSDDKEMHEWAEGFLKLLK